jgi:hypothetical protein
MTTPQFLSWLDAKMEQFEPKKLIPPLDAIREKFKDQLLTDIGEAIEKKILKEAKADEQTTAAFNEALEGVDENTWEPEIVKALEEAPTLEWRDPVEALTGNLAKEMFPEPEPEPEIEKEDQE